MDDVFRAEKKQSKSMADRNRDLDLTPRAKTGWNCFQCCFPTSAADETEQGKQQAIPVVLSMFLQLTL